MMHNLQLVPIILRADRHIDARQAEAILDAFAAEGWHFLKLGPVTVTEQEAVFPYEPDYKYEIKGYLNDEKLAITSLLNGYSAKKYPDYAEYLRRELWERVVRVIARKLNPDEPIYMPPDNV